MNNFIAIVLLITFTSANYQNGKLESGEHYNKASFGHISYSVYQLPYGITFHQMMSENNNILKVLLTHTPCPAGRSCSDSNKLSKGMSFSLNQMTVDRVTNMNMWPGENLYQPINQKLMRSELSSDSTSVITNDLSNGRPTGKLVKFRKEDVYPVAWYPRTTPENFEPKFGASLPSSNTQFVFDDISKSVHVVNFTGAPALIGILNIQGKVLFIDVDPTTSTLYVATLLQNSWKLIQYQLKDWSSKIISIQKFPEEVVLSSLFTNKMNGKVFLTFTNATADIEDFLTKDTFYIQRYDKNLILESSVKITNKLAGSQVWDYKNDNLYILGNGELLKFGGASSSLNLTGRMSMRSSLTYDGTKRANNFYLASGCMVDDNTMAIGTEWWGNLIIVSLDRFISPEDEEAYYQDVRNKIMIVLLSIFGSLTLAVCACICCVAVIGICTFSIICCVCSRSQTKYQVIV